MRTLFALAAVPVAVGALALTGVGDHQRPARQARLLSASTACSSAADCVQGCAVPVAARAPARSSTSPCAKQPQGGCVEYVAAQPAPPGERGEASCPPGGAGANAERLLSPRTLREFDQRSRRALRKQRLRELQQRAKRALRKHTR